MSNTPHRSADYQLIADTAANKEGIANLKEDVAEIKADVHDLTEKLDEHVDEVSEKLDKQNLKLDAVIAGLSAQKNQLIGASRLAKFLWFLFPAASAALGWLVARKVGA